jgi:hypothetical protein
MRNVLALSFVVLLVACGGGGGGGGPTDPGPVYPSVAGSWSGVWSPISVPITVRLNLTQGSNGTFTGTFTSLGTTIDITGTVTPGLAFTWRNSPGQGCGTLAGTGQVNAVSATQMTGDVDLDSRVCTSGSRFFGPVTLNRTSSAPAFEGTPGTLDDLLKAIERMR